MRQNSPLLDCPLAFTLTNEVKSDFHALQIKCKIKEQYPENTMRKAQEQMKTLFIIIYYMYFFALLFSVVKILDGYSCSFKRRCRE